MKNFFILCIFLFAQNGFAAYQCPQFKDFYQDKNNVWHLTKIPEAPPGTFWKPMTQGPWAPHEHKLDSIDVSLTYGAYQDRVSCMYGRRGNYFMGVNLHVSPHQKPYPAPGSQFQGDIPNDCFISPENCEFVVEDSAS